MNKNTMHLIRQQDGRVETFSALLLSSAVIVICAANCASTIVGPPCCALQGLIFSCPRVPFHPISRCLTPSPLYVSPPHLSMSHPLFPMANAPQGQEPADRTAKG